MKVDYPPFLASLGYKANELCNIAFMNSEFIRVRKEAVSSAETFEAKDKAIEERNDKIKEKHEVIEKKD